MPEMQDHDYGTFSWADIATTDIEGAKAFYGALMGWEFDPGGLNERNRLRRRHMPEMQDHDYGTFSWADIATTDIEGAKAFYGALMGWEFDPQVVNGELVYTMCKLNGLNICGLGGTMAEGQPACWNVYTCVEDVDAMSAKVSAWGDRYWQVRWMCSNLDACPLSQIPRVPCWACGNPAFTGGSN